LGAVVGGREPGIALGRDGTGLGALGGLGGRCDMGGAAGGATDGTTGGRAGGAALAGSAGRA
jgi:hypothetical protein